MVTSNFGLRRYSYKPCTCKFCKGPEKTDPKKKLEVVDCRSRAGRLLANYKFTALSSYGVLLGTLKSVTSSLA